MLLDIHAKTTLSPGTSLTLSQVIAQAKAEGLDGVAFTETLSSAHCQQAIAAGEAAGVKVFIGVEIPTDRGILLGFAPSIDAFYLAEQWRRHTDLATPDADAIIALFDSIGGAIIAARPYDLDIPYNMGDQLFTFDTIHGVEVFTPRVGEVQSDFALEASRFLGAHTTGGSDPVADVAHVGQYATFFAEDVETQQDFVNVLRDGDFWAVQLGKVERDHSTRSSDPFARRDRGGRGDRDGERDGERGGRGGGRGGDRGGRSGGRGGDRGGRRRSS